MNFKIALLIVFFTTLYFNTKSQNFRGNILYNITYKDTVLVEDMLVYHTGMPVQVAYFFGDSLSKKTWIREDSQNTNFIYNYRKKKFYSFGLKINGIQENSLFPLEEEQPVYKVQKTSESSTIAGFHCQKYKIEEELGDKVLTHYFWTTSEIQLDEYHKDMTFLGSITVKDLPEELGFPLKVIIEKQNIENVKSTIISEAIKIEMKKLENKIFEIPKD